MRLGIDFDNTIVSYDAVFHRIALERALIPSTLPVGKSAVRDHLRRTGQEDEWTEMQGLVYGARMREAEPFPGVVELLARGHSAGVPIFIISHKTRFAIRGEPYDLHLAAKDWLEHQRFFDPAVIGLDRGQVFLEPTRAGKLARIRATSCTHFIDDLPEFLLEPEFPASVTRLLFDPTGTAAGNGLQRVGSWYELGRILDW